MESTTLNPLFSEEEILDKKNHYEKALKEAKELWSQLTSPKTDTGKLEDVLECARLTITSLNRKGNYQKMIEANISILNGKGIAETEEEYYETELMDAFREDEAVQKRYKELAKEWH